MFSLKGKSVGDTLIEFVGPIYSRNFDVHSNNTNVPDPLLEVYMYGPATGSIRVQYNTNYIYRTVDGSPNPFSFERIPDPDSWQDFADSAGVVAPADGTTEITLTPEDHTNFLRVIVETEGEAKVLIRSVWR